ncbi:glutaredoxin family protein [Alicyclobacillus sp. SO9]|uniref:glutaredoxin family protein n=1 Tax=Alicyclobacillus sp. SO9 TaxID=2665646 RepID=UPI001E654BE2|nr:glutaredoxin family protein [Alicyclobacillus sp. SO9]
MKEFLSSHQIQYQNIDLTENPEKEADLKKKTGGRIVPGIVITKKGFLGLGKKEQHFIGFEQNKEMIERLIL